VVTALVGLVLILAGAWMISDPRHEPTVIGVMQITPGKGVDPDACNFTRDGLNTVMSSLPRVQVYSKQKIDFLREKRGLSDPEVAEELGIGTMVSGSLTMRGDAMVLTLDAVDGASGMLRASRSVSGKQAQLADMQAQAVFRILEALGVPVTEKEQESLIANRSNDGIERYNLTTQMMGGFVEDEPPSPGSRNDAGDSWWPDVPASAFADDRSDVVAVLEQYRKALEEKNMAGVSATYVSISDGMRGALERFFADATDVKVTFSDYDVEVGGDEALATFTRVDDFLDQKTGQRVRFEIRVSSILAKQADGWRIRGLKKPS
jgi:hypothetical protein